MGLSYEFLGPQEKWAALNDAEREFFHQLLPWWCVDVQMGFVDSKNIDEFLLRINASNLAKRPVTIDGKTVGIPLVMVTEDMEKFLPFCVNVPTIPSDKWAKKKFGWDSIKKGVRFSGRACDATERRCERAEIKKEKRDNATRSDKKDS